MIYDIYIHKHIDMCVCVCAYYAVLRWLRFFCTQAFEPI